MQEIHDTHHEEHPLHVAILPDRATPPPAQEKKHTKRTWIIAFIAVVAVIGLGLGLGLGLDSSGGNGGWRRCLLDSQPTN